jgi:ribosomal protein S18 acetylase RimI-like enzyme
MMYKIEPITDIHRTFIDSQIAENWAGPAIVSKGVLQDTRTLPGFAAVEGGAVVGYVLYNFADGNCEVSVLQSLRKGRGIGRALVGEVIRVAKEADCRRLWLITTNDNTAAIRFYQMFGFELRDVYINAVEVSRRLKPQIPTVGCDGIGIRHEFEFEMALVPGTLL